VTKQQMTVFYSIQYHPVYYVSSINHRSSTVNILCRCNNVSELDCQKDQFACDSQFLSSKH